MLNWDDPLTAPTSKTKPAAKPASKPTERALHPEANPLHAQQAVREEAAEQQAQAIAAEAVTPAVDGDVSAPRPEMITALSGQEAEIHGQPMHVPDLKPVNVEDKRVINGMTDVNQLAPFKYPWAWEYFLNANRNHWTPLDINMNQDVHDYHHKLTLEERHVYENVLAYLTTSDILAMRNIGLAVMEKMSAPELQIYQARQVYEESLHTWTYQHCIESIGLDQGEIYNRYRVVPEINGKIQIANRRLSSVLRPDIDLKDRDELHNFLMAYIFFAGVFEGCWFYNGFSPIFALQRRGLMKGTAEQLQYIMRDEVLHASFGIRVAKQIMLEEDIRPDPKAIELMWEECEAAESAYAGYLLRDPILGYSKEDHVGQYRFIANRRAKNLGLDEPYPGAEATLPWLDEQANMRKEKNFFETRVTEYQTGGALKWE